jgi:hypothetical protein
MSQLSSGKGLFHQLTGVPFTWVLEPGRYKELVKEQNEQLKIKEDIGQQLEQSRNDLISLTKQSAGLSQEHKEAETKRIEVEKRNTELRKMFEPSAKRSAKVVVDQVVGKIPVIGPVYTGYGYYKTAKDLKELKDTEEKLPGLKTKEQTLKEDLERFDDYTNIQWNTHAQLLEKQKANERALTNMENVLAQRKTTQS